MIRSSAVLVSGALIAAWFSPLAYATGPTLGTPCDDTNKIVATETGEMMCTIISTGPAVQQWQLFSRPPLETVVNGSTCGPAGTNGDFRYARSTDSYLVWCVRPSFAPYPIWTLAQP